MERTVSIMNAAAYSCEHTVSGVHGLQWHGLDWIERQRATELGLFVSQDNVRQLIKLIDSGGIEHRQTQICCTDIYEEIDPMLSGAWLS